MEISVDGKMRGWKDEWREGQKEGTAERHGMEGRTEEGAAGKMDRRHAGSSKVMK
jgi:hypothetical protein